MPFRFFRRMKILPGVSLNFSKSGISPSFGVPGARVTLGKQGVRKTVGVPGTGLYYTELDSDAGEQRRAKRQAKPRPQPPQPPQPQHNLELGFFERLLTPESERAFVAGCRAYVAGDRTGAMAEFRKAPDQADAAFLLGFLELGEQRFDAAEPRLRRALENANALGSLFDEYGLAVELNLPITAHIVARIRPARRGVLLGLAELYQARGQTGAALDCLRRLRELAPDDVVVKLAQAELIAETWPDNEDLAKRLVELAADIDNESSIHAALLLYKARALRRLGLDTAARDTLTAAYRRKKNRDPELLRAIRYERALVYADLGRKTRARRELEGIYAEAPDFEDVAQRLGL